MFVVIFKGFQVVRGCLSFIYLSLSGSQPPPVYLDCDENEYRTTFRCMKVDNTVTMKLKIEPWYFLDILFWLRAIFLSLIWVKSKRKKKRGLSPLVPITLSDFLISELNSIQVLTGLDLFYAMEDTLQRTNSGVMHVI